MALPDYYDAGTISVENGSTTVTGTGTAFLSNGIKAADKLGKPSAGFAGIRLAADPVSNDELILSVPWPYETLEDSEYEITITPGGSELTRGVRLLLETLTNGALAQIATISGDAEDGETLLRVDGAWAVVNGALLASEGLAEIADIADTASDGELLQRVGGAWAAVSVAAMLAVTLTVDNNFIQRKSGAVVERTPTQVAADLLGLAPDGASVATPGIAFASDPNTGIWRSGTDQLDLVTGGATRARVLANGRVLIGTTTDSGAALSVGGTVNVTNTQNGATSAVTLVNAGTGNAIAWWEASNGTNKARMGVFGAGYTPNGALIPNYGVVYADVGLSLVAAGGPLVIGANGVAEIGRWTSTGLGIGMTATNVLDITKNINNNATISILNNNNGTGASTDVRVSNGSAMLAMRMFGTAYTPSGIERQNGALISGSGGGGLTLATTAAQPLHIATNSVDRLRAYSSGAFFIGDISVAHDGTRPGAIVLRNASASAYVMVQNNNSADNLGFLGAPAGSGIYTQDTSTSSNQCWRMFNPNGNVGGITVAGSGVTFNTTSDERLKNFDVPQRDFRAIAQAIMLRDAEFIANPGEYYLAISAQQCAAAGYYDAITCPEFKEGPDEDAEILYWSADYGRLAPLALWVGNDNYRLIEEQAAALADHTQEIADIKQRLTALEQA